MKLNKSEKILIGIFFLLASIVVLYNLFYIPSLPKANVIKKEIVLQDDDNEKNAKTGAIDINSATIDELTKIPGIGKSTAQKIIDYRETNGGFITKSEIMNVSGIGQKKYDSMKDYIFVNGDKE